MENFNLAQLTKEMVVHQIRSLADPTRLAAEVARGTIIARLRGRDRADYEVQEAVTEVCRGAVAGLVLMECPMPKGAVRLLRAADAAARKTGLDRALVAIAALKGISDARRFVTPDVLEEMRGGLAAAQRGAGEVFGNFCTGLHPHQSHPDYIPPRV